MLLQRKRLVNFLITLYFIFFSLPMILICGFPWSHKWQYMYGIKYLDALLHALTVISPWALLLMAIFCHKKELKLQAYVATALFFWAAITELFVILFHLILEHPLRARLGRQIASCYEAHWDIVKETCGKLSVSSRFSFDRVGYVLIGAYSLDMIDKFAEEGKIMPRAPKRKSGNFYMWAVENGMDALGRYGMHSGQLGEYGFATFGGEKERKRTSPPDHRFKILMKEMNEKTPLDAYNKFTKLPSSERENLKKKVDDTTLNVLIEYERKYQDNNYKVSWESEKYLREWLYLDENLTPSAPIYTQKDMELIRDFVDNMSTHIFRVIYKNLDEIQSTFKKCKASEYADFAEFFCWLYHLTFTETMDYLIKKQKLKHPLHGYEYWIWKK